MLLLPITWRFQWFQYFNVVAHGRAARRTYEQDQAMPDNAEDRQCRNSSKVKLQWQNPAIKIHDFGSKLPPQQSNSLHWLDSCLRQQNSRFALYLVISVQKLGANIIKCTSRALKELAASRRYATIPSYNWKMLTFF